MSFLLPLDSTPSSLTDLRSQTRVYAIESAVLEAKTYVQNSPVVGADETSFNQGNVDGSNSKNKKAWL